MSIILNRDFKIWSYTVSHSTLILRSSLKFSDQDDYTEDMSYNIDIEFTAVAYIELPQKIMIKTIQHINHIPLHLSAYEMYKIFELKTEDQVYYVVASNCIIGTNNWISEDRIFNFDQGLIYDRVLYNSQNNE